MVKIKTGCVGRDGLRLWVHTNKLVLRDMYRLTQRNEVKHFDSCILLDGGVGGGKSTMGITTLAPLLASSYKNIFVLFEGDELVEKMVDPDTPEFSVLVLDESTKSLASGQALKKNFQRIRNIMMLCRMKHYYIIIILPSFFMLPAVFALFRSDLLLHIFTNKKTSKRGYFRCYGKDYKKKLYLKGKKTMDYGGYIQKENYSGTFALNEHIWEHVCPDYLERKAKHFQSQSDLGLKGNADKDRTNFILETAIGNLQLIKKTKKFPPEGFTIPIIAEILGIGKTNVSDVIQRMKLAGRYPKELYTKLDLVKMKHKNALTTAKLPNSAPPLLYNNGFDKNDDVGEPPIEEKNETSPVEPTKNEIVAVANA